MRNIILLLVCFGTGLKVNSQSVNSEKGSNAYFELGPGFSKPIYMNNTFSEEMVNPFARNGSIRFGWYPNASKRFALGVVVLSYSFGPSDSEHERIVSDLIDKHGVSAFGDIFVNDFAEWDFGFYGNKLFQLNDRFFISTDIASGLMFSSRREWVYSFDNGDSFVYNVNEKGNRGFFVCGELGINYLIKRLELANFFVKIGYEMTYGRIPQSYQVRHGSGSNINVYDSYQYETHFSVWRHSLSLKLRMDYSIFNY